MNTRELLFGYLKGLLQRWYLVALAVFDLFGLLVQPFLNYEIPIWGHLVVLGLVFILANFLLYREGQEEILAIKQLYDGKLSEFKQKIKELENRRPVLDLFFQVDGELSHLQVIEVLSVPQQPNFDEMIRQEAEALKRIYAEEGTSASSGLAGLQAAIAKGFYRQLKTADEYEQECARYLTRYRHCLIATYNDEIQSARFRSVSFAIQNRGIAPAEDITLFIHFPDEFYFLPPDEDTDWLDYEECPEPPERPKLFKSLFDIPTLIDGSFLTTSLPYSSTPPSISDSSNTSGPFIKPRDSTEVRYEVKKLLHNMTEVDLDPVGFFVTEEAVGHSWELEYSLHAGNLPEPITGSLLLEIRLAKNKQPETSEASGEG